MCRVIIWTWELDLMITQLLLVSSHVTSLNLPATRLLVRHHLVNQNQKMRFFLLTDFQLSRFELAFLEYFTVYNFCNCLSSSIPYGNSAAFIICIVTNSFHGTTSRETYQRCFGPDRTETAFK